MAILGELCFDEVNDEQVLSTYQYVIELRELLEQTCKLARENLENVQTKQNTHHDKRARSRKFDVSDKVLYYYRPRVTNCYFNVRVHMK